MSELDSNVDMFRVNLIDSRGILSFLAPAHGPKMIAAVLVNNDLESSQVLARVSHLDSDWVRTLRGQIARFDEFCVEQIPDEWKRLILAPDHGDHPAFRALDSETRRRSLQPASLGLIIFNLNQKRVIQIQNSYRAIEREGQGRYRREGRPASQRYRYRLPDAWTLTP